MTFVDSGKGSVSRGGGRKGERSMVAVPSPGWQAAVDHVSVPRHFLLHFK